jgi:hypothetical protein
VRPFPNVNGGKWQVSSLGASGTRWSKDGRLLYVVAGRLMAGKVTATSSFAISDLTPALNDTAVITDFALGPGGRLLVVKPQDAAPVSTLNIVLNWSSRLPMLVKPD